MFGNREQYENATSSREFRMAALASEPANCADIRALEEKINDLTKIIETFIESQTNTEGGLK